MKVEILEGDNSDVFFATGVNMIGNLNDSAGPKRRPVLDEEDHYSGDYTPWGDDNLHPQNVIEKIEANDTLPAVIDFKVKALTSGGLMYGVINYDEATGQEIFMPKQISEVDDFLSDIEHDNYLHETALDFYTHANHFVAISKNLAGNITDLFSLDAAQCRLGLQEKSGKYKGLYRKVITHGEWEHTASSKDCIEYQAVDPYRRVAQQIREHSAKQIVIPVRLQTRGRIDYAKGPVDFLIASKWLDIAKNIPIWKDKMNKQRFSAEYQLEVEAGYWKARWKDWDKFTATKKTQLKRDTYRSFIDFFKGAKESGNILITNYHREEAGEKEWSEWKVTKIPKDQFDSNTEESVSSDAHIIRALGVDHTLINLTPGTGFTSGSGSDKRVAFNQHVLMTQPEQRRILRPFDYIAEINNWHRHVNSDEKLRFWFKNTFIATLDHGKDTKEANTNNNKKT